MAFHQLFVIKLFIIKRPNIYLMLINNTKIHHNIPSLVIDNDTVIYSSKINNRGMTIDNRLSFKPHITEISKSVDRILHTIRPSITTNLAKFLVTSLVHSRLDYHYTYLYITIVGCYYLLYRYNYYINNVSECES